MSVYLDPITHPDAWNLITFSGSNGRASTPRNAKILVGKWTRKNDYDIKVGKGTAGATETLKGQPPAEGTITFWAWTPQHFAAWDAILDVLRFDPSKGGNATTKAPAAGTGNAFTSGTNASGTSTTGGSGQTGTLPTPGAAGAPKSSDGWPTNTGGNAQPSLSAAYAIEVFHPALADINVHYVLPPKELGSWEPDGEGSGLYKREIAFVEFSQAKGNVATTPTGAKSAGDSFALGSASKNGAGNNGAAAPAASGAAATAGAGAQGAWGAK